MDGQHRKDFTPVAVLMSDQTNITANDLVSARLGIIISLSTFAGFIISFTTAFYII